jgi:hypothetical protein
VTGPIARLPPIPTPFTTSLTPLQMFDEKNVRRRVYDALNVLMAMDIISRDKKEIRWNGMPGKALDELADVKVWAHTPHPTHTPQPTHACTPRKCGCCLLPLDVACGHALSSCRCVSSLPHNIPFVCDCFLRVRVCMCCFSDKKSCCHSLWTRSGSSCRSWCCR